MAISTIAQTVSVDEAVQLTLSAIEADPLSGDYVRDVRVFATGSDGLQTEVFRLRVRSATREGIEVATPSLTV